MTKLKRSFSVRVGNEKFTVAANLSGFSPKLFDINEF